MALFRNWINRLFGNQFIGVYLSFLQKNRKISVFSNLSTLLSSLSCQQVEREGLVWRFPRKIREFSRISSWFRRENAGIFGKRTAFCPKPWLLREMRKTISLIWCVFPKILKVLLSSMRMAWLLEESCFLSRKRHFWRISAFCQQLLF